MHSSKKGTESNKKGNKTSNAYQSTTSYGSKFAEFRKTF